MNLPSLGIENLQEIVKKKLLGNAHKNSMKQKMVGIDETQRYLSRGWQYVAHLPGKKVVIKSNSE